MRITNEAKKIILEAFEEMECDCLIVESVQMCCGEKTRVVFGKRLPEDPEPVYENDIALFIQEGLDTSEVSLEMDGQRLIIQQNCPTGCHCQ